MTHSNPFLLCGCQEQQSPQGWEQEEKLSRVLASTVGTSGNNRPQGLRTLFVIMRLGCRRAGFSLCWGKGGKGKLVILSTTLSTFLQSSMCFKTLSHTYITPFHPYSHPRRMNFIISTAYILKLRHRRKVMWQTNGKIRRMHGSHFSGQSSF